MVSQALIKEYSIRKAGVGQEMGVTLFSVEALLFVPLTQCLHPKPYTLSTTALLDRRVCCSSENVPTLTLTLTLRHPFDFGRHKLVL